MTSRDYVGVWGTVEWVTERALRIEADGETYWIPLSQIDRSRSEIAKVGDEGLLYVSRWFAEYKRIIVELDPDRRRAYQEIERLTAELRSARRSGSGMAPPKGIDLRRLRKRAARALHPDRNHDPDAGETLAEINAVLDRLEAA